MRQRDFLREVRIERWHFEVRTVSDVRRDEVYRLFRRRRGRLLGGARLVLLRTGGEWRNGNGRRDKRGDTEES